MIQTKQLIDRFEIMLEHDIDEQYQYEPGQVIRGHVMLKITDIMKVKAIQVQVKGEATVSWEDDSKPVYRADETYIDVSQNLVQAPPQQTITLEKGKHQFPLEYELPTHLPSSFIGKYGSITYVVKATLKEDKKFGINTSITSEPFLVMRRLDLSKDPQLQEPCNKAAKKRLWGALAFCISGKVEAEVGIRKTGYVPGEDVFVDAEVTNNSPRIVRGINASIVMHSTFSAKNNSRYNIYTVNKKRDELELSMGDGHRWRNVRITIPPYIPETRLDGCDIIDIKYELIFRVEISGGNELKIAMPLTVGTVSSENETLSGNGAGFHAGIPNANTYNKSPNKYSTPNPTQNGELPNGEDMNGNIANEDDIELKEEGNFRHPMTPGDTRNNPLFR